MGMVLKIKKPEQNPNENGLGNLKFFTRIKLLKVLERTGLLLKIYRSGKLPKLVKFLPFLKNFEEIIWLLRPDSWSPQALYSITRFFISNLDNLQLGRFFSLIIVPRLQEAIFQTNKIPVHLFLAIKISTHRSKKFLSSILFPLFKNGSCTTKEAVVLGSILSRVSLPFKNAIWALVNMLEHPCSSPKVILIRIFLSKNYVLPYRVLDLLVDFFSRNSKKKKNMNFRKCYYVFFKNYSVFLSTEDRNRLSLFCDFNKK